jgi:chemotaxis signal transduction protein
VRTIVRFQVGERRFGVPVERVAEVRSAQDLTPLPAPRPGVAGLMRRGADTITVLQMSDVAGGHVMVVEGDALTFGLLVGEVTGVQKVEDTAIGPPPAGQGGALVNGVIADGDDLVLLLDVVALGEGLAS